MAHPLATQLVDRLPDVTRRALLARVGGEAQTTVPGYRERAREEIADDLRRQKEGVKKKSFADLVKKK